MGRRCCWEKVPQNRMVRCRMPGTGNTPAVSSPLARQCSKPKPKQQQLLTSWGHATNSGSPLAVCMGPVPFSHVAKEMAPWDIQVFAFFLRSSLSHILYVHIPTRIPHTSPRSPTHGCTHSGTPKQQQGIFRRNVCIEKEMIRCSVKAQRDGKAPAWIKQAYTIPY